MWYQGFFLGVERLGCRVTTPSVAEVKNEWVHASAPSVYLRGVDRENLFFIASNYTTNSELRIQKDVEGISGDVF